MLGSGRCSLLFQVLLQFVFVVESDAFELEPHHSKLLLNYHTQSQTVCHFITRYRHKARNEARIKFIPKSYYMAMLNFYCILAQMFLLFIVFTGVDGY